MTAVSIRFSSLSLRLFASAHARLAFAALTICGALVTPSPAEASGHVGHVGHAGGAGAGDTFVALASGIGHHGPTASKFMLASAGLFFFFGLLFGAWKYACMARSEDAQAPPYVDIAHRAALLYSFACVLLAQLCGASAWSNAVNLGAAIVLVLYFAAAVLSYAVHGALRDTDNQLKRPHRLGKRTIGDGVMRAFLVSLIVAEVGAFLVIFSGYLAA
jgi:hypothetical protein